MQSQGRGKGFRVVGEYSALGDGVLMGRIARRLHSLHGLIEGDIQGVTRPEALRLKELEQANSQLEDAVVELEDDVRSLEEELKVARGRIAEHEEAAEEEDEDYEELLELVNEALSDVYTDEFEDLAPAVRALVDEYSDVLEEAVDLSIP